MTEAEAKVVLEQAAWQPLDDKLGEGGGGWVFRCLSMGAYYSVQHVVEALRGDGFRGDGFKKAFPEFLELIDSAIKGEGALKTAIASVAGFDKVQVAHLGGVNFDVGGRRSHELKYKPNAPKLPDRFAE
jgi:hypothetical protein